MYASLRRAYMVAAVSLLTVTPWGEASVALVLFVAVDVAAAALMLRSEPAPAPAVVAIGGDTVVLPLLRRTVPGLRMRRPRLAIDAQIEWRQAVEARRRRREFGFSLRR